MSRYLASLPPSVPEPKLFSIFAEKFLIDSADSLMIFNYLTHVVKISVCFVLFYT